MGKTEIVMYVKHDGKCPVQEFLHTLNEKMLAKILHSIKLLEMNGFLLREPYSKLLRDGIFELRVQQANNIVRILYFFVVNNKVVFTNGFVKKTQKIPKEEIDLALKYKKDYLQRKDD